MKIKKIFGNLVFTIVTVTLAIAFPLTLYVVNNFESLDSRSSASELDENVLYVYPNEGDCATNGKNLGVDCFEKGDGIQEAINAVPDRNESSVTHEIIIGEADEGQYYKRDSFEIAKRKITFNADYFYKCLFYVENKNIRISSDYAYFNGLSTPESSAFCGKNSILDLSGFHIAGMRADDDTQGAYDSTIGYSSGKGIMAWDNSKLTITNNQFDNNKFGIWVVDSDVEVKGNLFQGNLGDAFLSFDSNVDFLNNISYKDKEGFRFVYFKNSSKLLNITNNTFVNEESNINLMNFDNDELILVNNILASENGLTIRKNPDDIVALSKVHDNLVWRYDGSIDSCKENEICNFSNRIKQDPKLKAPEFQDYSLDSNSPAIDKGDPDIKDPDGSRSDIGAYGGPGACLLDNTLEGCDVCIPDCTGKCGGKDGCGGECENTCTGNKPACAEDNQTCVECISNAECLANELCVDNICEVQDQCRLEEDGCGSGQCCSGLKEYDVLEPPNCEPDSCGTVCLAEMNCGNGVCEGDENICYCPEDCENSQCTDDQDCNEETPYCKPNENICVECVNTSDCDSGYVCLDDKCLLDNPNGSCNSDSDCLDPKKPYCYADFSCVECLNTSNCSENEACIDNKCESIPQSCNLGDINCDDEINMADYTYFVNDYLAYKDGEYRMRSDLNQDQKINMSDYTEFVRIYLDVNK